MKSPYNLLSALLDDLGSICSVETARDLETIKSRAQHEGLSFYTITLPDFASSFERALELHQVDSTLFSGWKKRGCLPAFLRGFTSLVFGASGEVKSDVNTTAIYAVRQICRVFKKVRVPCSDKRAVHAFRKFEDLEKTLQKDSFDHTDDRTQHFMSVCDIIWSRVLRSKDFNPFDLVPKHGPGATAEKLSGNAKYSQLVWHERLEEVFPFTEYLFSSLSQLDCNVHGYNRVTMIPPEQEQPVRVIGVPKTLKAPRIIAIEPVCMQYTQQAVSHWIMREIESSFITRRSIRFTDQTVNQNLAMTSSKTRKLSTIDLSDASDRVTLSAIRAMLRSCPDILQAVEACRSRRAELPNGNIISLSKFASMGSALCFPIESMYFYSILVHNSLWIKGKPAELRNVLRASRRLHVYGDDLIVPIDETASAFEALAYFGCKVNTAKSFSNGFFRESCGCDAYGGTDVTPVYVRELAPQHRRSSVELLSWISTSNQFHMAGCWKTAAYMKYVVQGQLGVLPVVSKMSPGLGWHSFCGTPSGLRMCSNIHAPVVRTYKVCTLRERDSLNGYPALLKFFLRSSRADVDPIRSTISKDHLRFSARSGSVSRKRHWVPYY